jgi:hypothetical protein
MGESSIPYRKSNSSKSKNCHIWVGFNFCGIKHSP